MKIVQMETKDSLGNFVFDFFFFILLHLIYNIEFTNY